MPVAPPKLRFASAINDAERADEALSQIVGQLGETLGADADLAIVFVTPEYADALPGVGEALSSGLGAGTVVGGTVQGVVGVGREMEEGPAISVLAGVLGDATVRGFAYDPIDYPAVVDSPTLLLESTDIGSGDEAQRPAALMMLADPFSTPLAGLLPAVGAALPGVPVVGGMLSGGRKPRDNRLLFGDQVRHDGAVGLAFDHGLDIQTTISQGCRPIGRPWVITKSKRHIVQELGGRKALEVLRETLQTLGERDRELAQTAGLQVGRVIDEYKSHFGRGDFLIRGVVGVDPDAGYLAIGDPQVRVGQTIQFQVRDAITASDDLSMMLDAQRLHGDGEGALLFTCNSRGTRLYDRKDADVSLINDALGTVPLAGCFAAGEIGPVGGENHVHGHAAALMVFREKVEGGE